MGRFPGQVSAVSEGAAIAETPRRILGTAQALLGAALVGAGLFWRECGGGGRGKKYIKNQKWDEQDQGFKITAPTEP